MKKWSVVNMAPEEMERARKLMSVCHTRYWICSLGNTIEFGFLSPRASKDYPIAQS